MTTPAPVFRRVRSGYEPEAVDRHLHQIVGRLRAAETRATGSEAALVKCESALRAAQAEATAARDARPDLMADDLVRAAQRQAEELLAEARREAAQIRLRAQTDAERSAASSSRTSGSTR